MQDKDGFGHPFTAAVGAELIVVLWIFLMAAFLTNSEHIVTTIWSMW